MEVVSFNNAITLCWRLEATNYDVNQLSRLQSIEAKVIELVEDFLGRISGIAFLVIHS